MAKEKNADGILSTSFEEGLKDIGLSVMRQCSRGNVFLQLGNVKTQEQFDVERENFSRPNFDILKQKKL